VRTLPVSGGDRHLPCLGHLVGIHVASRSTGRAQCQCQADHPAWEVVARLSSSTQLAVRPAGAIIQLTHTAETHRAATSLPPCIEADMPSRLPSSLRDSLLLAYACLVLLFRPWKVGICRVYLCEALSRLRGLRACRSFMMLSLPS
jgi:hypothetical protein